MSDKKTRTKIIEIANCKKGEGLSYASLRMSEIFLEAKEKFKPSTHIIICDKCEKNIANDTPYRFKECNYCYRSLTETYYFFCSIKCMLSYMSLIDLGLFIG